MYLAEKALRMQTAALKYEVAAKPDKQREEELEALLTKTSRRLDTVNVSIYRMNSFIDQRNCTRLICQK